MAGKMGYTDTCVQNDDREYQLRPVGDGCRPNRSPGNEARKDGQQKDQDQDRPLVHQCVGEVASGVALTVVPRGLVWSNMFGYERSYNRGNQQADQP